MDLLNKAKTVASKQASKQASKLSLFIILLLGLFPTSKKGGTVKLNHILIGGFMIVALLVGVVGIVGINETNNVTGYYEDVTGKTIPTIKALDSLRFSGLKIVSSTKGRISLEAGFIAHEEKELKEGKELYYKSFKKYEDLVNKYSPDKRDFLKSIRITGQELNKESDEIIELKEKGISGVEVLEAKEEFEDAEKAFLKILSEAIAHEDDELADRDERIQSVLAATTNSIYTASIVIFFLAISFSFFISRTISKPLAEFTKSVDEVSKGNFNVQIEPEKAGKITEIRTLAESLDRVMITMKLAVDQTKGKKPKKKPKT